MSAAPDGKKPPVAGGNAGHGVRKASLPAIAALRGYEIEKRDLSTGRHTSYIDHAGRLSIGHGHRITPGELKGWVYLNGLTDAQADALFARDVSDFEARVIKRCPVNLTQGQFDALLLFAYSTGFNASLIDVCGGLAHDGPKAAIARMAKYNRVTDEKTGKKIVSPELENRRQKEIALFVSGSPGLA